LVYNKNTGVSDLLHIAVALTTLMYDSLAHVDVFVLCTRSVLVKTF